MLQFNLRLTVNRYDEGNGRREKEFDWDDELKQEMVERIQSIVSSAPVLIDGADEVYVLTVSGIHQI